MTDIRNSIGFFVFPANGEEGEVNTIAQGMLPFHVLAFADVLIKCTNTHGSRTSILSFINVCPISTAMLGYIISPRKFQASDGIFKVSFHFSVFHHVGFTIFLGRNRHVTIAFIILKIKTLLICRNQFRWPCYKISA